MGQMGWGSTRARDSGAGAWPGVGSSEPQRAGGVRVAGQLTESQKVVSPAGVSEHVAFCDLYSVFFVFHMSMYVALKKNILFIF